MLIRPNYHCVHGNSFSEPSMKTDQGSTFTGAANVSNAAQMVEFNVSIHSAFLTADTSCHTVHTASLWLSVLYFYCFTDWMFVINLN